jgi:hypothetical protein
MRVCLITEKTSLGANVLPYIHEMHPALDPDGFVCAFVSPFTHLNTCFRYPRNLAMRDYPWAGEPAYEPFAFGASGPKGSLAFMSPRFGFVSEPGGGPVLEPARFPAQIPEPVDPGGEAARRLRTADIVYVAVDPGASSTLALDRCLDFLGVDPRRVAILRLFSLSSAHIRTALADPARIADPWYAHDLAAAGVRRRFDYAYQVNALALHGQAMRAAGAETNAQPPTKYGLQLLYDMHGGSLRTEGELVHDMGSWEGTGSHRDLRDEHGYRPSLGGTASRHQILHGLTETGLTEWRGERHVAVSTLGLRFLSLLHPNSRDRDLPFRLEAWKTDPDGTAKVDRYIRTFFGRQIRFLARRLASHDAGEAA